MRDEDAGDVQLVVQPPQPAAQLLAHLGVERAERLVQQQHLGFDRQRARQRDALPLAAGELVRVAVGQPVELHQLEQLEHLAPDLLGGRPLRAPLHPQPEGDVLEHGHVPEQRVVLEHEADLPLAHVAVGGILAVEQHGAAVGHLEPGDHAQQRGLAAPGRPEQGDQLAGREGQADIVQGA